MPAITIDESRARVRPAQVQSGAVAAGSDPAQEARLRDRLDQYFAGQGMGFNAYLERRTRMERLRHLESLSDAELASRGLERGEIPRHVFRDLFDI